MENLVKTKTKSKTKTSDLQLLVNLEKERRDVINKYIDSALSEGTDYGTITIRGQASKPSLFKPGSEKMCSLFNLTPMFERDDETWEMLGQKPGLICYKCVLKDANGNIIAEGRGTALTSIDGDFDVNKQVKIAQKRAQTDAVLRPFALSDRFTQDVEDLPNTKQLNDKPNVNPKVEVEDKWNVKIRYLYKLMHEHAEGEDIEKIKKQILTKCKVNYMNQLSNKQLDTLTKYFENMTAKKQEQEASVENSRKEQE